MTLVQTRFVPKEHGFHFPNSFETSILSRIKLPLVKPTMGELMYGLCGGMCCAALDYYYAKKPVPTYTQVNEINYQLFHFLWDRQLDTLDASVLTKLIKWMLYADSTVMRRTITDEVPPLRASIDQGQPVVLSLVRVKGFGNPTLNHQVVVVAYDFDPASQQMILNLYDPNWPGIMPRLTLNLSQPAQGIATSQPVDVPPRGFFIIPYQGQPPP
jgi:hypothetical protein